MYKFEQLLLNKACQLYQLSIIVVMYQYQDQLKAKLIILLSSV